ncbi:oocyte zinc finger protein XlCOF7.1-like [Hyla sarda]|uniref:oocyte zinc finger protein XlCOF7.1-like n=1 Tax=Hyla sarda TaxID=327740 RepID=UPI0024C35AF8|nr:oocyte zinc finger protein XlCOF7.1-like [Hyla sarda]
MIIRGQTSIMDKNKMNESILSLTLEIIYLLTGEDYTVVKNTSKNYVTPGTCANASGGLSWNQELPSQSYERNNVQKLLDLACKIVELLTAEVPIRCQDVAVYFSMEEWEYVEGHKDLYQDIMEDPRPLTPSAGFGNEEHKEQNTSAPSPNYRKHKDGDNNGHLVHHTMCESSNFLEESCNKGNFTNPINQTQPYPLTYIKEEPVSNDGKPITEPNVYPPTDHTQQDTTTIIKEESASSDGGNLTQYWMHPIKKELDLSDGGTAMDPNIYTPTHYTQHPTIKREPLSCDEDIAKNNACTSINHIQYLSPYIKEEPLSCDEVLTESHSYRPSDHTQHQNTCIQEEPVLYDGGNLKDSCVYTPTDHTQNIRLPSNKEPGNGGVLIDLNDYTQHPTTPIKEKMVSCHRENPIDHDSHTPSDHRQPHPTTHIKEKYGNDITDTNSDHYIDLTQNLVPHVEKESASSNRESLVEMDIQATVDGSTYLLNKPIPIDHIHHSSTEEPVLGKEPSLQKHKCSSPEEPEAKDGKKRKKEVEQNYMDLTLRSEKFNCTVKQATNYFQILYNCPECPACFPSNVELAKHQLNHTRRLPFICSLCGRCFGRKSELVVHQVFHGSDTNASTHGTQMDAHGNVDGTEQPRPPQVNHNLDSYDGERFTTPDYAIPSDHTQPYPSSTEPALEERSSLQKPESSSLENKDVGNKSKKQPEKNNSKIRVSSQKYFCTIHHTTDSIEILYNCPECPEIFTSNLDLAKHQIIHAGGLSIICAVCGVSFGRKSDLLIHQITHGGSNNLPRKNSKSSKTTALLECGKTFLNQQTKACLGHGKTTTLKDHSSVQNVVVQSRGKPVEQFMRTQDHC